MSENEQQFFNHKKNSTTTVYFPPKGVKYVGQLNNNGKMYEQATITYNNNIIKGFCIEPFNKQNAIIRNACCNYSGADAISVQEIQNIV